LLGEGHVEIGEEAQRFGFERFQPFEQIMAGTLLGAPARVGFVSSLGNARWKARPRRTAAQ